jgi:hypothetical protein
MMMALGRTPRLTTVEAARVLHVPRIVEAVREQRRRHRDVMRMCQVKASQVRILAKRLGVRLPRGGGAGGKTAEVVPGAPADVAVRNVCHILGTAMSMLFKGERNYAYPVRVLGSGVAGLAFFMSDGTVIKTLDLHLPGQQRSDRGGLVPGRARSIPEREFLHELAMTRQARRRFGGSGGAFSVPGVQRAVILRGPKGARVGVMQQTLARGMTVAAFLRNPAHPQAARLAAARAHGRAVGTLHASGWVHGDPHTENAFVAAGKKSAAARPRITLIDWGRANTRRLIERYAGGAERAKALWAKFLRYESAWPYRDMAIHGPGRPVADAYLEGYVHAARGPGGPIAEGIVNPAAIRTDYYGLVENNTGAMFTALELVSRGEARAAAAKAEKRR